MDRYRGLAGAIVALAGAATCCTPSAAIVEVDAPDATLAVMSFANPEPFLGSTHDFSLLTWAFRDVEHPGEVRSILASGALTIAFDDVADTIAVRFGGSPVPLDASLPLRGDDGAVPVGEWILIGCSYDETDQRLSAWAVSESAGLLERTDRHIFFHPDLAWPVRLGAARGVSSFTGALGLLVIRDHRIHRQDVDFVWNDGAPHQFAPLRAETGSFNGPDGVVWMVNHSINTDPNSSQNFNAKGSQLGDLVTENNYAVFDRTAAAHYYSPGRMSELSGDWRLRSPYEEGEAWSGFFARELPDLGLNGGQPYVELVAPNSRRLALDEPDGLTRVMVSANSRAVRGPRGFYDDFHESWSHGGILQVRQSSIAGIIVAGTRCTCTKWPAFTGGGRSIGDVQNSRDTTRPSMMFGNFGSHGSVNANFPKTNLAGIALVIEPGASYVPKAAPVPGTLLSSAQTPLMVRAMLLRHPGAGTASVVAEKAETQFSNVSTLDDLITEHPLNTTEVVRVMSAADAITGTTLSLDGDWTNSIEPGDGCAITDGQGSGGISVVLSAQFNGEATTLELEQEFAVQPTTGSALEFGAVEAVWVEREWAGLSADDIEVFRGLRITAIDRPVVMLFAECYRPGADGFIIGSAGKGGSGYAEQIEEMFDGAGVPFMAALQIDVWLQFFAHQGSPESSMADYSQLIRAESPDTEIWWCGDPDLDTLGNGTEGTDDWQHFILENAEANGVGAIVAHEHPSIGTGNERAIDGQCANKSHLSARGNLLYVEAVLDLLADATVPDDPSCAGDVDANGFVDFHDLLLLLAYWGTCDPGPCVAADLNEDGSVGFTDLILLLGFWGPCP